MSDEFDAEAMPADDARLLDELGQALGSDPLPAGLLDRAEGLLTYLHLDRELAALLDDPEAAMAGTRSTAAAAAGHGRLEFEVEDGSVSLELSVERDRVAGQILSGSVTEVTLERLDGDTATAVVDELGRFAFDHVPAGPARLRLGGAAHPVTTDWFLI
jgi:hypothetical protein